MEQTEVTRPYTGSMHNCTCTFNWGFEGGGCLYIANGYDGTQFSNADASNVTITEVSTVHICLLDTTR
jgi:hypothetical protein